MGLPRRRLPRPSWPGGPLVGAAAVILLSCVGHHTSGQSPTKSASTPITLHARQLSSPPPLAPPARTTALQAVNGVVVSPLDIPAGQDLTNWVGDAAGRGITTLLVEIGARQAKSQAPVSDQDHGIFFRSGWAPIVRDLFGELIPIARRHGVAVFGVVSPRDMNWIDPTLGWMDRFYDIQRREVRLSPYLDLFHPAFQEYLIGLLTDLAETGVDGVLFRNTPALGPYDGLSSFALGGFQGDFSRPLDPAELFLAAPGDAGRSKFRPEFWQWMGWKARERVNVLDRLARAMRLKNPALHVALEVHREAVMKPVAALVRYAEDLLESKRRFEFFLLSADRPPLRQAAVVDRESARAAALSSMAEQLENPARIWLGLPMPSTGHHGSQRGQVPVPSDVYRADTRIGVILMDTDGAVP